MGVIGNRHRGFAVEGDGVDECEQQAGVFLLVAASKRATHLQCDDVGVGGRFDVDLLLGYQRHVVIDDQLLTVQGRWVQRGAGAVTDQRDIQIERDLGDPAAGVRPQQQRGDEQGGSESHDPARGHPQHDCSVHVAATSFWSLSVRDTKRPPVATAPTWGQRSKTRSTLTAESKVAI
jgi:hypothetical protein